MRKKRVKCGTRKRVWISFFCELLYNGIFADYVIYPVKPQDSRLKKSQILVRSSSPCSAHLAVSELWAGEEKWKSRCASDAAEHCTTTTTWSHWDQQRGAPDFWRNHSAHDEMSPSDNSWERTKKTHREEEEEVFQTKTIFTFFHSRLQHALDAVSHLALFLPLPPPHTREFFGTRNMKWWAKKWKSTQWQTREICKYDYSFASFTTVGSGFSSLFRLGCFARTDFDCLLKQSASFLCRLLFVTSFFIFHSLSFVCSFPPSTLPVLHTTMCVWFLPIFLPPHTAEFTNNRRSSHARFSHHLLFSFIDFIRRKATTSCRWDEAGGKGKEEKRRECTSQNKMWKCRFCDPQDDEHHRQTNGNNNNIDRVCMWVSEWIESKKAAW